jgi:hypothetical protein
MILVSEEHNSTDVSVDIYLNGSLFYSGNQQSVDNRLSLGESVFFFLDDNAEEQPTGVSQIVLYNCALTSTEISDLGDATTEYGISKNSNSNIESENNSDIIPSEYSLTNYPNPFNPSTNIAFTIPNSGMVKIVIYDMLGREVAKIADNYYEAGSYTYQWNAAGNNGRSLTSGMYIARIEAGSYVKMIKMLLLK